jgi:hypothetical protein
VASLLVTLSTGTIVFTATFRKDLAPEGEALRDIGWLLGAWVALGLAVLLGIVVIGALAATLNKGEVDNLDVYERSTKWAAVAQFVFFLFGIPCFAIFAYQNLPA